MILLYTHPKESQEKKHKKLALFFLRVLKSFLRPREMNLLLFASFFSRVEYILPTLADGWPYTERFYANITEMPILKIHTVMLLFPSG